MNLTRVSIDRPVFAWMLMASLILFGWISFRSLGVSSLPNVDFPVVNVSVTFEGASPEVMESDVVDILENAVMGVEGLISISSSARYGRAHITLEFDLDRSVDVALQEVQSKVSQAQRRLPQDIEPPVVTKNNPEDQPIMWLGLSGNWPRREMMKYARDKLLTQFQLVPGVGDLFLGGYLEPSIRIWLDVKKLESLELSVDDVIAAIQREHVELPAGILEHGDSEYTLRVIGEATSVEDLSKIIISRRGGSPVFSRIQLKDVARIESGTEDERRRSRVLGENAVGIGIRKQRNTNAVEVANGVRAKLDEISKNLPEGLKIGVNFDSTKFIKESVDELLFELVLSALLTGLVCWLFLGSFQSTFNILLAIPTSLIGTFMAIKFLGFTLNTFTLLGLILAVGIVVDDAIMVLENIVRHRQLGKRRREASLDGTNEISFAAMATTLAIVAIFLPVAFMEGVIGKFFFEFGVTISVAVLISLLEALTLTPMRCSQFLEETEKHGVLEPYVQKLTSFYRRTLSTALLHKGKVLLIALLVFCSGFIFTKFLRQEFVPSQDQGLFLVRLRTDVGASLDYMDKLVSQAEERIIKIPEIERFFVSIGGFGGGQVNTAMMFVTLKEDRDKGHQELMELVRGELNSIKGLRAVVQDLSQSGFGAGRGFPIEFTISGPEWDKIVELVKTFEARLSEDKRFKDVDTNYEEGSPEIRIRPKRDQAAALGVSVEDISRAIGYLIGGERVARFTEDGKRIDVRVRAQSEFREDPKAVLNLFVRNNRGELIRLGQVADLEIKKTLLSITREERERGIRVYSNIAEGESQADLVEYVETFRKELPPGYGLTLSGGTKSFGESFGGLIFALWLGIAVAYMILASQFNSFVHGFTVLLSLPFSLTGAWLALWLGGKSMNVYSMIGLILLMGIVKKNSIMLVDFTNQRRAQGKSTLDALMDACPIRLRPILMTSITIIAASLPPIFGLGPGSETRSSMSLAVVGGVAISTIFTLYVVPAAYLALDRLIARWKKTPEPVLDIAAGHK